MSAKSLLRCWIDKGHAAKAHKVTTPSAKPSDAIVDQVVGRSNRLASSSTG